MALTGITLSIHIKYNSDNKWNLLTIQKPEDMLIDTARTTSFQRQVFEHNFLQWAEAHFVLDMGLEEPRNDCKKAVTCLFAVYYGVKVGGVIGSWKNTCHQFRKL